MNTPDWRDVALSAAPLVATALGGPLAGLAATVVGRYVLGKGEEEVTSIAEAQQAIVQASGSPEALMRLKEAEMALRQMELQQEIRFEEIAAGDRADARQRDLKANDGANTWIAKSVLTYFAATSLLILMGVYAVMTGNIVVTEGNREVLLYVVALVSTIANTGITGLMLVLNYHFGSSGGSKQKEQIIDRFMTQSRDK